MDTKLIAALACVAALALGACSGNNASGTTGGGGTGAGSGNNGGPDGGNGNGGDGSNGGNGGGDSNGGAAPTPLQTAETEYEKAQTAVTAAVNEAQRAVAAGTEAARANAERLITAASMALAEAVRAADAAVAAAADGSGVEVGAAARVRRQTLRLQSQRTDDLNAARDSLAWYGRNLVRYELASGEAVEPRESVNTATVVRIPRTIPNVDNLPAPPRIPQNIYTQIPNPKRFDADTFKTVMYEDGNRVFSVVDDGEGGDEFKVNGYVNALTSSLEPDTRIHTGLKLTDGGLVIRTGGTATLGVDDYGTDGRTVADYTDMRRDITRFVSDTSGDGIVVPRDDDGNGSPLDGIRGQNGWDLEITFDEPQTRSVPVDFDDISNPVSSWTGNNAFYWRAIAPADPSQLDEDGDNYKANAFNQPKGYRDLGTYEVWLSNHVGLDRKREPAPGRTATCPDGSRETSCPSDDEHRYLKYAAYGLFAYTASTETFKATFNGQLGRINTLHFGYSAFGTGEGQKTENIGQAITGGKFHGYTLAYEFSGINTAAPNRVSTKLLRGDVTLTVNIPKESGRRGTVEGTLNNFQQWNGENKYWTAYDINNFTVALNSAAIGENGAFSGNTLASPTTDLNPSPAPQRGRGVYNGSFYGPRADAKDLEIAGSWTVGTRGTLFSADRKTIYGSFGAKQRPPETPASD